MSSLRKTIIIQTASIIEALLLWKLKKVCQGKKVKLANKWEYFDLRILYEINNDMQIIAGFYESVSAGKTIPHNNGKI